MNTVPPPRGPLRAADGARRPGGRRTTWQRCFFPRVAAWTAYLLCHHLTGRFLPSLVGGYLFGFSSYMLGHVLGQPQLTAVFAIPLIALVLVRAVEGSLDRRGIVLRLSLLLALQLYLSLEVALTLTIVLALALVARLHRSPRRYRRTLLRLLVPLALSYAVAAVLAAPILYYALTSLRVAGFTPPAAYTADVLNFVLPTHLEAVGSRMGPLAQPTHWPGNSTEQGAFVGLPLLVIVVLYARTGWRTLRGRFLLVVPCRRRPTSRSGRGCTSPGTESCPLPTLLGHETLDLPVLGRKFLPLFDNVLPVRFLVYASLASAVIVALWIATTRHRTLRWLLPALTVLLLLPNPGAGVWATTFSVPPFFTERRVPRLPRGRERTCCPSRRGRAASRTSGRSRRSSASGWPAAGSRPPRRACSCTRPGSRRSRSATCPSETRSQLLKQYFAAEGVTARDRRQAAGEDLGARSRPDRAPAGPRGRRSSTASAEPTLRLAAEPARGAAQAEGRRSRPGRDSARAAPRRSSSGPAARAAPRGTRAA